jgi:predicted RNA-binding Zn ribbon-like protein
MTVLTNAFMIPTRSINWLGRIRRVKPQCSWLQVASTHQSVITVQELIIGYMPRPSPFPAAQRLVAGRLALDFANIAPSAHDLSWDEFVFFLVDAHLVSDDRAARLRPLLGSEPQAVDAVLLRILRLRESLRAIFASIVEGKPFPASWVEPVNEILRITEGHDELVSREGSWFLHYVARESGLEWLLAAIARSAAELLVQGPRAPIRRCANPECRLFFYDNSRTHRRRWCSMAVCGNRHKVASFLRRHSPRRRTRE